MKLDVFIDHGGLNMKAFILSVVLMTLTSVAFATDTASSTTWVDTNNVFISHSQNPEIARRDCQMTMNILQIMNNDKIVFRSMCQPAFNQPRCTYFYCYQLSVQALFIGHHKDQE